MSKPKYIEKLYALIFLCIGGAFILSGALSLMGISKPTEHAYIQSISMGSSFIGIGVIFCIAYTVLRYIASAKRQMHNELLEKGIQLDGIVECVSLQQYTHYGKQSPFRIGYTYLYQGKRYHHKSYMLWDKPAFNVGDAISVYVNDSGQSTVRI